MGRKGVRSQKGQAESDWGKPKTKRLTVQLTEEGYNAVKDRAERIGISVSEVFERWGRGFAVDDESATSLPSKQALSVESILESLSRYSRYQIGRIVRAGLDLLIGVPPVSEKPTIRDLVREHRGAVLEMFDDAIANPSDRINQIIEGDKPTSIELSLLSAALPIDDDELMQMYKKEFPNGSNQGCTNNC
jgi:hypothetical protein